MAERIQRFAGDVPVPRREPWTAFRLVREFVVVVEWLRPRGAGPAERQLPSGIHVAEQHVDDRVATFHARVPRLENGGCGLPTHMDRARPAILEDDDERLARRRGGLDQLLLNLREIESTRRSPFATHARGFC